ncbi:MAG: rhomboid family intramembrane serine protease [Anaerolineae bacterium]|nr:rhomboid family intramembrane serine protease [Anaerolineae bacterium]
MIPLPIADTTRVRYRTIPWVTIGLIVLNVVVWFYTEVNLLLWHEGFFTQLGWVDAPTMAHFVYGTVPAVVREQQGIGALSAITATFLHAPGYIFCLPFSFHLLGNMVFLWAFGRRIEDACGPVRFLLFYLLAGLISSMVSIFIRSGDSWDRYIPGIGASGAIAGVMGAFLLLFPGTRITTIILIGVVPIPIRFRVPALLYLGFWLVQQVIPALQVTQGGGNYTTDFFAHLGGFFAGLLIFLFVRKDLLHRYLAGSRL